MTIDTVYTTTRSNGGKPTCLHADPDCRYVQRMGTPVPHDRAHYPDDIKTCSVCWPTEITQNSEQP